jgi:AcrR family transcriptional regulator
MSSAKDKSAGGARRPRNAAASRAALLEGARAVFEEVGYDRATTREIGQRAGVDPALIARYYDSKEGLFLAVIAAELDEEIDFEPAALLALLLERWDRRGHSPITRAMASPALSDEVREQITGVVHQRILGPLAGVLRGAGVADPELRADLFVAMALGIWMTRANGTLSELAAASREQVLSALKPILDALASA